MKFGLICEGVTDIPVLENIILSYVGNAQFFPLQPATDETHQRTIAGEFGEFAGWRIVSEYLKSTHFDGAFSTNDYVVIQIDTDVCEEKHFDVFPKTLADSDHDAFYELVQNKIIEWINSCGVPINRRKARRFKFYQAKRKKIPTIFEYYKDRIIFAISVHSIECWLLAYHGTKGNKIVGCTNELCRTLIRKGESFNIQDKDSRDYAKHSNDLKRQKNHRSIIDKSASFRKFVEQLDAIPI